MHSGLNSLSRGGRELEQLKRAIEEGRAPHAVILQSSSSLWAELERGLAAALLCRKGGCRGCEDCALLEGASHPDLISLRPQGRGVGIEETRVLKAELFMSPTRSGRKVAFVHGADLMSGPALTSLLKVLEEPPLGTHIFLLAERPENLPPTIRSRCWLIAIGQGEAHQRAAQNGPLDLDATSIASMSRAPREELLLWLDQLVAEEKLSLERRLALEKLRATSERANLSSSIIVDLAIMIFRGEVEDFDVYS